MEPIYRSAKTFGLLTIAALTFISLCDFFVILVSIGQIANPESVIDLGDDSMSPWIMVQGFIALFRVPAGIATIVLFLVWLNRSYKNLHALRPTYLRFSSGWAVGWWFVPFANLVRPFQVVREVWSESDPEIVEGPMFVTESLHSAPTYMTLWWALWLLANFATNIASKAGIDGPSAVFYSGIAFIISAALTIAAAVLAAMVIRDITARQSQRFLAVQALNESEAAAAAVTYQSQHDSGWQRSE